MYGFRFIKLLFGFILIVELFFILIILIFK